MQRKQGTVLNQSANAPESAIQSVSMESEPIVAAIQILEDALAETGYGLSSHVAKGSRVHKIQGAIRYLDAVLSKAAGLVEPRSGSLGKIYKTVLKVVILSPDPYRFNSLRDVYEDITDGDCSGVADVVSSKEVKGLRAFKLIQSQGSDPSFFQIRPDGSDDTDSWI